MVVYHYQSLKDGVAGLEADGRFLWNNYGIVSDVPFFDLECF